MAQDLSQEFDLEEIMREFGSHEPEEKKPHEETPAEEPAEDAVEVSSDFSATTIRMEAVVEETPEEEPQPEEVPEEEPEVLPAEPEEPVVEIIPPMEVSEQPENIPAEETPAETPETPQTPEAPEAFTDKWEPEFEQPMGEYVPPQPIIFQPRSRLRELKRQLIAGPEKLYYELAEKGLGKLQAAIFLSALLVILSGLSTALYAMNMVDPSRMRLMVFFQIFVMLLSGLLGSAQMIDGLFAPFRKRFTLNTLLLITFLVCCVDAFFCLQQLRVPCCAVFSLQVTLSLCNAYQERMDRMGMLDTMRKATRLDGVAACPDYYEGAAGFLRKEGQVEDFMDNLDRPSTPQKVRDIYALVAFVVSAAIAAAAGVLGGSVSAFFQVWAVSLLAAAPASAFVIFSRPAAILQRRLHRLGTVICGWQGIVGLSGKAVFPLTHKDLFPGNMVKMNGVKFFGHRDPDEIVAYSTALMVAADSALAPLFTQVLDSRNGRHYDAQAFQAYEGGIGCQVRGEPVLAGSAQFLRQMGVEVPQNIQLADGVYVAVDGELCGLFAMTYGKSKSTVAGLTTLSAHKNLRPLVLSKEFSLNEQSLHARLGLKTKRFLFPQNPEELWQKEVPEEAPCLLLTTRDGLSPIAYGITGARALRLTWILGLIIHLIGGILGLGIMLTLVLLGSLHLLTPANLLLYHCIWLIPGILITEWTRTI